MTTRQKALILVLMIIVLAAMGLVSCNAGKRLLQDQAALEELNKRQKAHDQQVAANAVNDFVRNNPCKPFPEVNLDSLCSIYYRCPDVTYNTPADDYTAGPAAPDHPGGRPRAAGDGRPKTVLVPWEDTRSVDLLKDSIIEKNKRLAVLQALIDTKDAEKIAAVQKVAADQRRVKKNLWVAVGILGLLLLATVYVIIKRPKIFS